MEHTQLTIVLGAFLFAALVKGVTGLGFSTTALPFLVYALGIKEALPLLIIPSITSNLIVMRDVGKFRPTVSRFRWLYLAVAPGVVSGLWLLNWLDPIISSAVLGIALIVYCVIAWLQPDFRLSRRIAKLLEIPVGFATGLINGVTGSQVMPVLPFLLSLQSGAELVHPGHQYFFHALEPCHGHRSLEAWPDDTPVSPSFPAGPRYGVHRRALWESRSALAVARCFSFNGFDYFDCSRWGADYSPGALTRSQNLRVDVVIKNQSGRRPHVFVFRRTS